MTEVSTTCGCFLLAGTRCEAQIGHHEVKFQKGKSLNYFMIASKSELGITYVCSEPNHHVYEDNEDKEAL